MESISAALGVGSGLDITSLVDSLAAAARRPKDDLFARRESVNQARIQALNDVSNSITTFASSLGALLDGGSLLKQPTSSDANSVSVSLANGARIGDIASTIEVTQIAKGQTLASTYLPDTSSPIGQGVLTLQSVHGSFAVTIDTANDSLAGLAAAINDAQGDVRASVITDSNGARLVLRGASGAAESFTLSVPPGTATGLERFAYSGSPGAGMVQAQAAQDAIATFDGVAVQSASNRLTGLIDGVTIDLHKAQPGTAIAIGSSNPTTDIGQAVRDFVDAYNLVHTQLAEAGRTSPTTGNGPLRGDIGLQSLQRQMAHLVDMTLVSQGAGPHTLSEIGVKTNRDGSLSLDTTRLTAGLTANPDAVAALFYASQRSDTPNVAVRSTPGRVAAGIYAIAGIIPSIAGSDASGTIDGLAMTGIGDRLIAPAASAAAGLILQVNASATSATITIDPGLSGALNAIRNSLVSSQGAFASSRERLTKEASAISTERTAHEARSTRYKERLLTTYSAMDRRVAAFRATQSYLEQQVAIWTRSDA
ncbi:MAG: flagellar filament capping protein FliD [Sphingopyxis sp.]